MQSSRGFTMLELLIAAALGLVLIAAVVQLFAGSSRSNALVSGQARLQESARHAVALLSRSARGAGYLGCGGRGQLVNGLNGDWRRIVEFDVSRPIEGLDGGTGGWTPALDALPTRGGTGRAFAGNRIDPRRLRSGSDVVVFRRVEAPGWPLARRLSTAAGPAASGSDHPLVAVDDEFALETDDFVVISDCRQSALFRVGKITTIGRAGMLDRPAGSGPFGNRVDQLLSSNERPYGTDEGPGGAAVARVVTEIYFVARGAGANNRGDAVWSLWRKTGADRPVELVQGVDELQVLFGVDLSPGDGVDRLERYVPATEIADAAVRAVHFVATVSSVDAVTADQRILRRSFAWTVAVRNG